MITPEFCFNVHSECQLPLSYPNTVHTHSSTCQQIIPGWYQIQENNNDWIINYLAWQYSIAATIWWNFLLASPSDMRPWRAMYSAIFSIHLHRCVWGEDDEGGVKDQYVQCKKSEQGWAGIPIPVPSWEWNHLIPVLEMWKWIFSFPSHSYLEPWHWN